MIHIPYTELLPGQLKLFHVDPDVNLDICMYQGGYGSGKTWGGSRLGILLCQKYPGITGLVVAKTFPLLRDTTLNEYLKHLERFGFIKGQHYLFNKSESKIVFPLWGNATLLFRHLQEDWKVKSLTVGFVEIEEASEITEADFRMLLSRLRQHNIARLRLFGHTNPQAQKGWIFKLFEQRAGKRTEVLDTGHTSVVHYRRIIVPTTENKFNPPTYLASMQDQFDPEYYAINVLGKDGDYTAGLVCKNWSIENEQDVVYNPDYPIHLSCDFNIDPMSWVLAQRIEGIYYFFDELVEENCTTQEAVSLFIKRYPHHKAGIIINGDASGQNRSTQSSSNSATDYTIIQNALRQSGYPAVRLDVKSCNPPVNNRIAAWNACTLNQNNLRRLIINPKRCKWLKWNVENLKYISGQRTIWEPTGREKERSRESKFYKHIWDAASYLVEKYDPIRPVPETKTPLEAPMMYFEV
jgi:PBSX family phage terminase large subunit